MPYRGRPSASCESCRIKKRRCDKATPACGQCRRSGQQCPGYRDLSTLVFRNETHSVIDRARGYKSHASLSKSSSQETPNDMSMTAVDSSPQSRSTSQSIPTEENEDVPSLEKFKNLDLLALPGTWDNLQSGSSTSPYSESQVFGDFWSPQIQEPDFQDMGVQYFLSNYILVPPGPSYGSLRDYVRAAIDASDESLSIMKKAIWAVVHATAANIADHGDELVHKAQSSYVEALQIMNEALMDPVEQRKDSTLMAIIFLGMYECITCAGEDSLDAWRRHMEGASNLLVDRGFEQFQNPLGMQIFQEATAHLLTVSSHFCSPLSAQIRFLRLEAAQFDYSTYPTWDLDTVRMEVTDLYHEVNPEAHETMLQERWEHILSQTIELDCRIETMLERLPIAWKYKIVIDPHVDPDAVWQQKYHLYLDTGTARIWNDMRACRLLLSRIVQCIMTREAPPAHLIPGNSFKEHFDRALATAVRMRDDILASVPQILGSVSYDPDTATLHLDHAGIGLPTSRISQGISAASVFFLLWPLFLAGSWSSNTPDIRLWVIGRLRMISQTAGVRKALVLANRLDVDSPPSQLHFS